jgi:indolepyruvate ferredoxin oxidoreductase alpha subunit
MMKYAFALSEEFRLPVVIRETRASASERGMVQTEGERLQASQGPFADFKSWKILPVRPVEKHGELHAKRPPIIAEFNRSSFNQVIRKGPRGILASGYMAAKVFSLIKGKGGGELSIFKLGTVYPPPEGELVRFLSGLEAVLVAEEIQPLIEQHLHSLAYLHNLKVRMYGKETGHLPRCGELFRGHLAKAIKESLGVEISLDNSWGPEGFSGSGVVYRPLPHDCPFYQAFEAFSTILPADPNERPIFVGDDGCLIRLMNDPFQLLDCKFCMGASIGMAEGLARSGERRKVVALIGDSSFFHTGLSAYLNAMANGASIMIVVLDNRATAMTGGQSNPGTEFTIRGQRRAGIHLESLLCSVGVQTFRAVEAFGDKKLLASAFKECLESDGLSVLLVSGSCPNLTNKIC